MDKQVNISSEKIYKGKCYPYLLKVFIIFSALAIVAILLLTSVGIYRIYTYHIIRDAETDAVNIGYMIFGQEKDVLLSRDSEGETQVFVSAEDIPILDQRMRKYLHPLEIVKIKVFSKKREIVFSTDHTIIGKIV